MRLWAIPQQEGVTGRAWRVGPLAQAHSIALPMRMHKVYHASQSESVMLGGGAKLNVTNL